MSALAGQPGVPVPMIWFTEADPGVLGAPFYVMDRVRGRVPGDVPSWHRKGWTVDLPPERRSRLHDPVHRNRLIRKNSPATTEQRS